MARGLPSPQDAHAWTWARLRDRVPPSSLRRALDHLLLDRVGLHDAGPHLAGRVGVFDAGASRDAGEGTCSCGQPQPCAHVAALLAAASRLDPRSAPPDVREAPRAAFGPGDPQAPVAAFPETASDVEIPADALSEAQRAAVEAAPGVVRKSATAYTLPRGELQGLAGALEAQGTGLVVFSRRPFVRLRASLRRGDLDVRLLSTETPGMGVRAILDKHGFRAVRKPKSLVHEFEGPAARLHLAAEEMALLGTAVVLPEGAPPSFEPLAPPAAAAAPAHRAKAPVMPVLFSKRRFEWWTPREGLAPLQLAILQRHASTVEKGLRFGGEGLRNAERELVAAGLHAQRVEDPAPVMATATAAEAEGVVFVRLHARTLAQAVAEAFRAQGYEPAKPVQGESHFLGPAAHLPALAVALAQAGVHLQPGPDGWPPLPDAPPAPQPLFADDPRVPLAREGALTLSRGSRRLGLSLHPEGAILPRSLRVELYRMGYLTSEGKVDADLAEAGRLVALLKEGGFEVRWPKPTSGEWRLCTVRFNERTRKEGGGTLVHLKGPIPLGRMAGVDPGAEQARIAALVHAMEASLLHHHPDAKPLAHGAMPGMWTVPAGAGAFLVEASQKGASVTTSANLNPIPLGRGVVLVDQSCLPPRLMEFRRTVGEDGNLRPVVSPEIENVLRRVVPEGLEVDEERGHYLVPSTKMGEVVHALRELGAKVLQRRLAPRGARYARWEPKLPEDETGARPKLRPPFRGRFEGEVPGLRPECVLDPHQREGLAFILHHRHSCLLADEMGLGKAQPLDAKVLTPTGWRRMGELRPGDEVINSQGSTSRITGVFPQGVKEVFRVTFSDGASTECCDDHLWQVNSPLRKWQGLKPRVLPLRDLRQRLTQKNGNRLHYVPLVAPVQFSETKRSLDAYLLGALLGDGGMSTHVVHFSTIEDEMAELVRERLPPGITLTHIGRCDWRLAGAGPGLPNALIRHLKDLGLMGTRSETKFVPDEYKFAPVEPRLELLRGLLDTDAYVDPKSGAIEFCTVSPRLAQDVVFLVQSFGGTARVSQKETGFQLAYRIGITMPNGIVPFRLSRKAAMCRPKLKYGPTRAIVSVEAAGQKETQCISVDAPDRLYVTDDFLLTHNTLQAIASAQFLPGRVLVVCPASARAVWKQEVHAWTYEQSRVLTPGDDPIDFLASDKGEKYVVVAYSGLAKFGDAIGKLDFDLVILDESHYVKSRSAQRTRLVEEKLRRIPRRLILSGTPVMNEPKEIRTQLAFVHPDEWSDTAWFNRRFQQPWKNGTPEVREAVLARLRDYLEGVMLRREKRQALPDLPEKHLRVARLALPPESRRAYDEQEDEFRDYVQEHEETALTGGMATTAGRLERLKQTALVGKLPLIVQAVKAMLERGEKVVVFCHYREPIKALAKELAPYGVVTLTGASEADERGAVVKRFQEDPDTKVFIGQTVAAGVAVTLTAARHAVFCDLEWNPALHRQAMDRIHRKTQTRDVEVHFFLAEDTVEEDVAEVLEEKTQMMDQLLEGRTGSTFGLRDKEVAQREVALRILSRRRRLRAGEADGDDD